MMSEATLLTSDLEGHLSYAWNGFYPETRLWRASR